MSAESNVDGTIRVGGVDPAEHPERIREAAAAVWPRSCGLSWTLGTLGADGGIRALYLETPDEYRAGHLGEEIAEFVSRVNTIAGIGGTVEVDVTSTSVNEDDWSEYDSSVDIEDQTPEPLRYFIRGASIIEWSTGGVLDTIALPTL